MINFRFSICRSSDCSVTELHMAVRQSLPWPSEARFSGAEHTTAEDARRIDARWLP
jgi:hypothetical protein